MNKLLFLYFILIFLFLILNVNGEGPVQFITGVIQNNVVGPPLVHQKTTWDFEPDIGVKRRPQFYEVHGYRAEKLIERLGLGVDGNDDERLYAQRLRDTGRLNGEIYRKEYQLLNSANL